MHTKLIFLLSLLSFAVRADSIKDKGIKIEISNLDKTLTGEPIKIEYFNYYSFYGQWPCNEGYVRKLSVSTTSIELKNVNQSGYIKFSLPAPYNTLRIAMTPFLAEDGDRIKIVLDKGKLSFAGYGSDKYNCQLDIKNIDDGDLTLKSVNEASLTNYLKLYDGYANRCLGVLENYKSTRSRVSAVISAFKKAFGAAPATWRRSNSQAYSRSGS